MLNNNGAGGIIFGRFVDLFRVGHWLQSLNDRYMILNATPSLISYLDHGNSRRYKLTAGITRDVILHLQRSHRASVSTDPFYSSGVFRISKLYGIRRSYHYFHNRRAILRGQSYTTLLARKRFLGYDQDEQLNYRSANAACGPAIEVLPSVWARL